MHSRLFILINPKVVGNSIFNFFSIFSYFLAFLTIIVVKDPLLALISLLFNLFLAYTYKIKEFRILPGMILLVVFNTLYIQIPILYMCYKADDYNFQAFIDLPNDNNFYFNSLTSGLLYFILCYFFVLIGMLFGNIYKFKNIAISNLFTKKYTVKIWVLIGLLTFIFTWIDNANIFFARSNSSEKSENFLALLFNDKTFLLVFPCLFYFLPSKNKDRNYIYFLIIFFLFLLLNLSGTSKGALLQMFTFFFLGPLSFFYCSNQDIFWPKKNILFIGIIVSIPLFLFSMFSRSLMNLGVSLTINNLLDILQKSDELNFTIFFELILDRLSVTLNNFILIFTTFSDNFSFDYSYHYFKYVTNSFLNLILPGTPFPESYVLTSQLLPQVLNKQTIYSELDKITLLQQANTQPYSLFGFFFILFSKYLVLIPCFIFGFLFTLSYNIFKRPSLKIIIMSFFGIFLQSYGIEAAMQFLVLTIVTEFILYKILFFFDRLNYH